MQKANSLGIKIGKSIVKNACTSRRNNLVSSTTTTFMLDMFPILPLIFWRNVCGGPTTSDDKVVDVDSGGSFCLDELSLNLLTMALRTLCLDEQSAPLQNKTVGCCK